MVPRHHHRLYLAAYFVLVYSWLMSWLQAAWRLDEFAFDDAAVYQIPTRDRHQSLRRHGG
jgi:hypothetical protein